MNELIESLKWLFKKLEDLENSHQKELIHNEIIQMKTIKLELTEKEIKWEKVRN